MLLITDRETVPLHEFPRHLAYLAYDPWLGMDLSVGDWKSKCNSNQSPYV